MNKTKRVLSVVLAVLMLSSLIAALAIADGQHTVVINYVFENGKQAAPSWTATLAEGSNLEQTVTSPTVVGYEPDPATFNVSVNNITANKTYTVTYHPANVGFTVNHYLQNVADNSYTLDVSEHVDGYTESEVGTDLAKKTYPGFAALLYNTKAKVAADGSTVVEIYYDRNYYMMSFNLDGGYGVEPIYARYGASVKVENPTKPGYTFSGWEPQVPTTVPAENTTYKAKWTPGESGFTVVFWYENANDDGYSYAGSIKPANVAPGTQKSSGDYKNAAFTGRDDTHFTYNTAKAETVTVKGDGSTVLNVYFTRNIYSMRLWDSQGNKEVDVLTITAKYQQDISGYFPVEFDKYSAFTSGYYKNSNYPNNGYVCNWLVGYEGYSDIISRVAFDIMPGENTDYQVYNFIQNKYNCYYYLETLAGMSGDEEFEGKNFKLYRKIPVPKNTQLTYDEEFFEIVGFERWKSDPEFASVDSTPAVQKENKFYYTRNSYNLKFFNYSGFVTDEGLSVQYEAPLKDKNFTPDYPADLEANAYEFAGWYTTEGCFDGSEVKWDTAKMPAGDVVLYAKWAPKTHTVTTWLTADMKDVVNVGNSNVQKIAHGSLATKPTDPTNGNYTFVGWFYEENGVEKAFDFSMPIVKDLNLYAKWSSNTLVAYTIKYVLEKDGTTVIADETTGSALAGTTLTFEAKTGDELNKDYQSGYFPNTGSHSMVMDIEGNNEFTFVYVEMAKVGYTVRYLDKATGEPVVVNGVPTPDKTGETSDAIITEKFKVITGYMPDSYQKRLVLSADPEKNVITFWYTKDEHHAPVQIVHWTQNIAGEGYTEYQSSTNLNGVIGQTYTGTPLTIPGFTYNEEKSNASGKLTANGLELNLYYDRVKYSYTVRYVDATDNNKDIDPAANVTGEGLFGAQVIGSQKEFNGYMPADNEPAQKSIIIGTGTNEIIFYYYPCYYIGHVRSGSLNNTDTIRLTGSKANLTAAVTPGYLYGGAFDNVDCTTVHDFGEENAINFTPVKGKKYYIWEVDKKYLAPKTYTFARPDQSDPNKTRQVTDLFLMTTVDRGLYQEVGFGIGSRNFASNPGVYSKVSVVYVGSKKLKEELYVASGLLKVTAEGEKAPNDRDIGYIGAYKLTDEQFTTFKTTPFTFVPYWVTLDGIRVTGINERQCTYTAGIETIGVQNTEKGSQIGLNRTTATQTVATVETYMVSRPEDAVVDVPVTPDVPETPEIPEVPEAPEMTLNSDAMYLRAQYTYEMMTNTVKFISAIDVNECTEYGFVINGEVVKCEEAAETVDGYDANYLFGGSVNGAMLMSCNMLLDGLVDGMTINVTPYYVALDGTTVVYGETRTLVYRQWVGLEG